MATNRQLVHQINVDADKTLPTRSSGRLRGVRAPTPSTPPPMSSMRRKKTPQSSVSQQVQSQTSTYSQREEGAVVSISPTQPRKRGRPTRGGGSTPGRPRKRAKRETTASQPQAAPKPSLGRLRRQTTGPIRGTTRREDNIYDHEMDEGEAAEPTITVNAQSSAQLARPQVAGPKLRQLNKRTVNHRSPFKGQGVVNTDVPGVHLNNNESPVRDLRSPAPILRPSQTHRQKPIRTRRRPAERNPTAEAVPQEDGSGDQHDNDEEHDAVGDQDEVELESSGDLSPDTIEEPDQSDAADDGRNIGAARRPLTQRSVVDVEQDEEDDERARDLIGGIENEVALHDCKKYWIDLLQAEEDIRPERGDRPESVIAQEACRKIKAAGLPWKDEQPDLAAATTLIFEAGAIIGKIREERGPESRIRGRDLYQFILPRLARFLVVVLKATKPTGSTPRGEIAPLVRILDLIRDTFEKARRWRPRPRGLQGEAVLLRVNNHIGMGVKRILQQYRKHYNDLAQLELVKRDRLREEERIRKMDEKFAAQEREIYRQMAMVEEQARAELRASALKQQREAEWRAHLRAQREAEREARRQGAIPRQIIDIDDLDERGYFVNGRRQVYPMMRKDRWTADEEGALVLALQRDTTADRFERIAQMLGKDVDVVRRRSIQLRQEMAKLVDRNPGRELEWRWLTSITED